MEKVEAYIKEIKKTTNTDEDICVILDNLNYMIKEVLITRIKDLKKDLKIHSEYQPWIDDIIKNFRYPIRWKLKSKPIPFAKEYDNERNKYSIGYEVQQQLLIFSNTDEIDNYISSIVNEIKIRCESKYMFDHEMILLHRLNDLYKDLRGDEAEEVKKMIDRNFKVKHVMYEGHYQSGDFFESYESDVTLPETRYEAMVSLIDNSCLDKGTYLYPQNTK